MHQVSLISSVLFFFHWILQATAAKKTSCHAVLSDGNGTITSPNYPSNYSSDTQCSWEIRVASSMVISFQFMDFDIEDGDDQKCNYDNLAIQEKRGAKFKTSATFCGSAIPGPFKTTSNVSKVVFFSDESENRRGFKLFWKAVELEPLQDCGQTSFNASSGSLQSPSFPRPYHSNLNCLYTISVKPDHKILLTICDIDIEFGKTCQFDSLEIFEKGRFTSRMLGKYCGDKEPKRELTLNGPTVIMKFTTDGSNAGRGFNITWVSEKQYNKDNSSCGLKYHITRIVGGVFAGKGEFPWQAAFFWRTGRAKGTFFCGGALISNAWVLTAAHCFVNGRNSSFYTVILGEHNIKVAEGREQVFNISKIIVHEDYDVITHDNDIALVKLEREPLLTEFINTLCLPRRKIQPGLRCQIAGWGATVDQGLASNVLMKAEVPLVNHSMCSHPDVYGSKITRNMMCAGYASGGVDSCQGDSGGPLVCRSSAQSRRWELHGIASWGRGCGRQLRYGVYTVARNYLQWIARISNELPFVSSTNRTVLSTSTKKTATEKKVGVTAKTALLMDITSIVRISATTDFVASGAALASTKASSASLSLTIPSSTIYALSKSADERHVSEAQSNTISMDPASKYRAAVSSIKIATSTDVITASLSMIATSIHLIATSTGMIAASPSKIAISTNATATSTDVIAASPKMISISTDMIATSTNVIATSTYMIATSTDMIAASPSMIAISTDMTATSTDMIAASPNMISISTDMIAASPSMIAISTNATATSTDGIAASPNMISISTDMIATATNVIAASPSMISIPTNMIATATNMIAASTDVIAASPTLISISTNTIATSTDMITTSTERGQFDSYTVLTSRGFSATPLEKEEPIKTYTMDNLSMEARTYNVVKSTSNLLVTISWRTTEKSYDGVHSFSTWSEKMKSVNVQSETSDKKLANFSTLQTDYYSIASKHSITISSRSISVDSTSGYPNSGSNIHTGSSFLFYIYIFITLFHLIPSEY